MAAGSHACGETTRWMPYEMAAVSVKRRPGMKEKVTDLLGDDATAARYCRGGSGNVTKLCYGPE